jgi:hypothetical protein
VEGLDPLKIKQRAGHELFTTTQRYIREAESVAAAFGEPFPDPPEVLSPAPPISRWI